MPLWQYKRRPTPPPRPVPKVTPGELSAALMDAIIDRDVEAARKVFEKAFWDKVDFRADGYHLMNAVRVENRDVIRLLVTHGATWTDEQARVARLIAGPDRWAKAEPELKRAGIRTQITEADAKNFDPVAATDWALRNLEDAERRGAPEAAKARYELMRLTAAGVALLTARGDIDKAVKLFRCTGQPGDGTDGRPLDASGVFGELAALEPGNPSLALAFVDALQQRGLTIKPISLTGTMIWMNPTVVPELHTRGLLGETQMDTRMNMLRNWAFVQSKIDTGAGPVELDPKFVDLQHQGLRQAAQVIFGKTAPVTPEEAQAFVAMHESRTTQTPHALVRMEKELLDIGFFDSPAFSVKQLKRLAETAPAGPDFRQENLAEQFNRRAAARQFAETGIDKFLSAGKFPEIENAHRLGAHKASAQETQKILDWIASRVKKDVVTPDIVDSLKILQAGGADFSSIDPNKYLGKKGPGLCKTLLDLGIVAAGRIDIEKLAARSDNELRPLTPKNAPDYAEQNFLCQALLERMAPEKFTPLRGTDANYLNLFLREVAVNKGMKRRFMTRSTGPR